MNTTKRDPVAFFYEHAGYSWNDSAGESQEGGRQRTARELASAEAWAHAEDVRFEWREDEYADRSGIDHEGPLWGCFAHYNGGVMAGLGSIDLGETGDPWSDPYARVIQAELAMEVQSRIE